MSRVWAIIDVSSLAHRARCTTGDLSFDGVPTGTTYGVLREARNVAERFGTEHFVWCFDRSPGLREKEFPSYKLTRRTKKRTPEEEEARENMNEQVGWLRRNYLEELGYENVLFQCGYEADDLIAAAVLALPKRDRAVLVSGDKDLYQLISDRVSVYQPTNKRHVTLDVFGEQWNGLRPQQWKIVKALAGCGTDDVHGLEGVAEKTAVKAITSQKKKEQWTATDKAIIRFLSSDQYRANLKLVSLPYPGCKPVELWVHEPPTAKAWGGLCRRLGMTSLIGRGPTWG
jgi:DNA polymerase I